MLTIVTHFAVTGDVRQRYPFSPDFSLELVRFEAGSFRVAFNLLFAPAISLWLLNNVGGGVVGNAVYDLLKYEWNSIIGEAQPADSPVIDNLRVQHPGKMGSLTDAATPSARRAHNVIGRGADTIQVEGNNNTIVVLNSRSKAYLENPDIGRDADIRLVSVGALNANSRTARVFDYERFHLVSAYIPADCAPRTMQNLSRSLHLYTRKKELREESKLYILYKKQERAGQPLRYYILDAWFEE